MMLNVHFNGNNSRLFWGVLLLLLCYCCCTHLCNSITRVSSEVAAPAEVKTVAPLFGVLILIHPCDASGTILSSSETRKHRCGTVVAPLLSPNVLQMWVRPPVRGYDAKFTHKRKRWSSGSRLLHDPRRSLFQM